ncbi:MAG: hypothetical protein EPO64_06475 [Nitrospirae bacterium]|nr:MAG: hypothetical protein EPO64_06475 [Nitrospirota bacterium]
MSETGKSIQTQRSSSLVKTIHYIVVGLLIAGGTAYWALKPPVLNPMADAGAAEAMALVQTHRAKNAPTLLQALTQRAQNIAARGQGVRLGEWTVESQKGRAQGYLVKVFVREEGTPQAQQWFEREYIWQVDVSKKSVVPLSMPAEDLMPPGEAGPLTRGDNPPGL